ncbi:MAG: hypothetical protein N2Z22_02815 [Turneriella sp.]|nr:hypothetical protein [Turneriella sp.]
MVFFIACSDLAHLAGQPQTPIAERHRQRTLSANLRAAEKFFSQRLPAGWSYEISEERILLSRAQPVYTLPVARENQRLATKAAILAQAKANGKAKACQLQFKVERHDDNVLVRQKLRLYRDIKTAIQSAHQRLKLRWLCGELTPEECSQKPGRAGENAKEFLAIRQILVQKLEPMPFYRIGTLYLYPLKDQCVLPELDWYFHNEEFPATEEIFPYEARDEIRSLVQAIEELRLWD